jgi:hypothetical protein
MLDVTGFSSSIRNRSTYDETKPIYFALDTGKLATLSSQLDLPPMPSTTNTDVCY